MQTITRQEAQARGLTRFYVGPCVHGHDAPRYTSSRRCIVCSHAAAGEYNHANPEAVARWARDWYWRKPEKARALRRARDRRWREKRV